MQPAVVPARELGNAARIYVIRRKGLYVVSSADGEVGQEAQEEEPCRHPCNVEALFRLLELRDKRVGGVRVPCQICDVDRQGRCA